jgi:pilus assembly protein CpaE
MLPETQNAEIHKVPVWPWRVGLVLKTPALIAEIGAALEEMSVDCVFRILPSTPALEIAHTVQREKPELLLVELADISGRPSEWIAAIRSGEDIPLVVAVHPTADPDQMISALRSGASEFLSLPIRPGIFDALDRAATTLEARRTSEVERGTMAGILSAKGGCGATSIACHLAVALRAICAPKRVLVADLDHQAPEASRIFRAVSCNRLGDAFDSVRRLNSTCWPDFVTQVAPGVDLLGGFTGSAAPGAATPMPEPWRIENLFRFATRQYGWILADLGRHLNPVNWAFLQSIDELFIVTAPDVLALYQTRSILQTLTSRGFDRSRVRLILNRNHSTTQDFWVESIEKMFELSIVSVLPNDHATLAGLPRDRFEFPGNSAFGRSLTKLANRMAKPGAADTPRRAA